MQIEIEVTGQKIKRLNSPGSVADTLNYLTCHFIFVGEEWDNTVRTAYFENQKSGERYAQIIADDGRCTVPWEALTDKGFVRFSVAGEREDYRITTDVESFYNSGTIYGGNPSDPPTPDQYDQMIALAEQTKEIAESVRKDANEGKFDGEPGKQGDPGKDGVSPTAKVEQTDDGAVITITDAAGTTTAELKNGKEGNPGQNATDEQVRGAVDAYMAEHPVQVDTDDLIKIAIKEEASGAVPIVITDSAEMGVQDLTMQGWTEQDGTEGKNLFDILDFESNNNGIIENGTILFKQSLGTVTYYLNLNPGTYSISVKRSGYSGINIKINEVAVINNGGSNNYTGNFDVSDGDSVVLELSEGQNPNGEDRMIYDVMLNEGSTALPYEPYTGGQPSPNPDYPQKIISAGKYDEGTGKWKYEVKLTGANLFNPEKLTGGEIVEYNGVQCYKYTDNLTNFTYIDDFAENTQYCINVRALRLEENENRLVTIRINYTDGSIQRHVLSANELVSLVSSVDKTIESISGDDNYALVCYLDLSMTTLGIGTEPLPFQPYKNQTVTLTADRSLTKWDKLEKRNGQWGWVYKSAEVVLDGSEDEDWMSQADTNGKVQLFITLSDALYPYSEPFKEMFYCDTFLTTNDSGTIPNWQVRKGTAYGLAPVFKPGDNIDSVDLFRAFLAENPTTILYATEEETFVPISETDQEALSALHTYYPTTVLDNGQGCEMSVQYIADTKAYIDKKISAI